MNKSFQKIEKPVGNGSQRKGCLWAIRPSKVQKMYEEVQKRSRKDPIAIRQAMVHPEHLELLERGEMKFVDGSDGMQDETESNADGSVASVSSPGSGFELAGQNIAYEEEEEEEEESISQEHVAADHPLTDGGYQEDNHEQEVGNDDSNVVVEQVYNHDLNIENFPADQITLPYHLYQLSPRPKRRRLNNSMSTQNARVLFQVQEDALRGDTPIQPQSGYLFVNIHEG